MASPGRASGLWPTVVAALLIVMPPAASSVESKNLVGLWEARRIFGPELQGSMYVIADGDAMFAEVGPFRVPVTRNGAKLAFELPDGSRFRGELRDKDLTGFWLQQRSRLDGNVFATPVRFESVSSGWLGVLHPQPDTGTFHLLVTSQGGVLSGELFNTERNLGVFQRVSHLEVDGDKVTLIGSFRGRGEPGPMLNGRYHADEDVLTLRYPGRGGGYEFRRVSPPDSPYFLARRPGLPPISGTPPNVNDGWETASPAEAGIDPAGIEKMIRKEILPPRSRVEDLVVHAVLIARNGKLVVEEYFHGYGRRTRHDSRSASKSVTAILAAASIYDGRPLDWDTNVYEQFDLPAALADDPVRQRIRLHHLVNMNSGLDCDDRNPRSAANEDFLWDNADRLDFYLHTLAVDIVHQAGDEAHYCSASPNLAGGVIESALDRDLLFLIDELIAVPLDIRRYSVPVAPDGHPFMGGGIRWEPRDFLKFPQLLIDVGVWRGRRIISNDDVRRFTTPAVKIDGGRDYAYLWWIIDYPYKDGTVRGYFMGGNGGQIAMAIPELKLAVVFNAGNYSDRAGFLIQNELIPQYILPSIRD